MLTVELGILPELLEQLHVCRLEEELVPIQPQIRVYSVVKQGAHRVCDWETE
jgi:hypothetical protein